MVDPIIALSVILVAAVIVPLLLLTIYYNPVIFGRERFLWSRSTAKKFAKLLGPEYLQKFYDFDDHILAEVEKGEFDWRDIINRYHQFSEACEAEAEQRIQDRWQAAMRPKSWARTKKGRAQIKKWRERYEA